MADPYLIRPGSKDDLAFVKASWRGTFHSGGRGAQNSEKAHYHDEMTRVFDRVFKRAATATVIACDRQDPNIILGFAVHTGPELHFVYVRLEFRKHGIARALLERLPITHYTFATYIGEERIKPERRGWSFTPRWTL